MDCVAEPIPQKTALYSAYAARELSKLQEPFDYVLSVTGNTFGGCEAIGKIKTDRRIRFLGFENPQAAKKYWDDGTVLAVMEQNVAAQVEKALHLSVDYIREHHFPPAKFNFLPSTLLL